MGQENGNSGAVGLNISAKEIFAGMNQMKTGIAIYDKNFKLYFANKAIRSYLPDLYAALDAGLSMTEAIKRQTRNIYPNMSLEECEARAEKFYEAIENSGTMQVKTPDGLMLKSTYDKTSRGSYILTTSDITAQVKTEEALRKARKDADSANKAKSDFLANMSHEIRTPLSGVFMAAQLLQQQLRMTNHTEMNSLAEILVNSTDHLSAIINDVLDMSKIEAREIDITLTENSLSEMLRIFKKAQNHVAKNLGLDLKLLVDPKLPERLIYDSVHVRQCVTNLVGNALKFTASGSVTIAVLYDPDTHIVKIHVVDTGIGIAPEDQNGVFDKFAQAKQVTPRAHMGTGLGLSISRQLARLMGGDIKLTSELGKGSIFTLTFPAKPAISEPAKLRKTA